MTQEQAQVTIQQLAGSQGRLKAMTGAKDFSLSEEEHFVAFKFTMCRKANYCRIHLNGMDLYDMSFWKLKKFSFEKVEEFPGVYDDMLKPIFEKFTGLYLSL